MGVTGLVRDVAFAKLVVELIVQEPEPSKGIRRLSRDLVRTRIIDCVEVVNVVDVVEVVGTLILRCRGSGCY